MYEAYIKDLITNDELPAATFIVKQHDVCKTSTSAGSFNNNQGEAVPVTMKTRFDVASLTKVMCTLPAILYLHERKQMHLDDPVCKYIKEFPHPEITIRHFLQHTSGFSPDLYFKNRNETRDVFAEILQSETNRPPNEEVVYSDLGMIILGKVIEKITNMRLDHFVSTTLYEPWGMHETGFLPKVEDLNLIAATEKVNGDFVHGEVHDEKSFHLGGVSGSAGLFSTVTDVAKYADYWLYPEKQSILKPETMALVQENVIQNRGLGFEVVQDRNNTLSCGLSWSLGSFGHTGFTGTSMWIDPQEKIIAVLLTNMVHYGRDHRLPEIRREFHTSIYDVLKYNK